MERRIRFWSRWVAVSSTAVCAFGLLLVVAPVASARLFTWLYFGPAGNPVADGPGMRYVMFVCAVLGAVMAGWAALLLLVAIGPFRRGEWEGWRAIAVSLAVWFVPDTVYSLATGFWPNAVLNMGLAALFAVPLAATYRAFRPR